MDRSHRIDAGEPGQPAPPPGLESHLRNLILSSGPSDSNSAEGPSQSPAGARSAHPVGGSQDPQLLAMSSHNTVPANASGSTTSQSGKKRLNQAQRRQMSSQLSLDIDPRAREPASSDFGRYGHQAPFPTHQRGHHSPHSIPGRGGSASSRGSWNGQSQQHMVDQSGFSRRPFARPMPPPDQPSPNYGRRGSGQLYNPRHDPRAGSFDPEVISAQANILDALCNDVVRNSEIERSEIAEKEHFRQRIEDISRNAIARYEQENISSGVFPPQSVELRCFGSLSSGFATKASDMDLGLLSPLSVVQPDDPGSPIPRILEKALLDAGLGARLLTRTRVPIIKLCERPPRKLYEDLVSERQKWEDGGEEDSGHHEEHIAHTTQDQSTLEPQAKNNATAGDASANAVANTDGDSKTPKLKQATGQKLADYYLSAKRELRRLGGRDVTMSNFESLSPEDWVVLSNTCEAFVEGLADDSLREILNQISSLQFRLHRLRPAPAVNRSLHGVALQIEGEEIMQSWHSWPGSTSFQTLEPQTRNTLRLWRKWQDQPEMALPPPVQYTKELQFALDNLKKLPVVQLCTLEQMQHELPSQYLARTLRIVENLRPANIDPSDATKAIIDRYVDGILQAELRQQVRVVCSGGQSMPELEVVARKHKSLHLAREFEKALERELYDDAVAFDIMEYIKLLRTPLVTPRAVVTVPDELLARIRLLQDPHTLKPNQPRDRYNDRLEFPKEGAGVQSDINFSAHLALQNSLLLRCYSHTDPRVRPMVLFIKHWAKTRGINSGYRGTLSSYGYVLMVLHYLVNVARPFVCPNLQLLAPPPPPNPSPNEIENTLLCKGRDIRFWRNEREIIGFAQANQLNQNPESIGLLLRGFFEYFAHGNQMSNGAGRGFDWGRDVLSLRSQGGLVSKKSKGWTGAKTVVEGQGADNSPATQTPDQEAPVQDTAHQSATTNPGAEPKASRTGGKDDAVKEVRLRYLFAIEDPFEHDHNVARTVTHHGIVSIRDEFRRAWRIIRTGGKGDPTEDLLQDSKKEADTHETYMELLDDIHGVRAV